MILNLPLSCILPCWFLVRKLQYELYVTYVTLNQEVVSEVFIQQGVSRVQKCIPYIQARLHICSPSQTPPEKKIRVLAFHNSPCFFKRMFSLYISPKYWTTKLKHGVSRFMKFAPPTPLQHTHRRPMEVVFSYFYQLYLSILFYFVSYA